MTDWFGTLGEIISRRGFKRGLRISAELMWANALGRAGNYVNYGISPYDRDWDFLVVLDACRYDLFTRFAPKHDLYSTFESITPVYSCASTSKEWLKKVYERASTGQLNNTYIISANGWVDLLDLPDFFHIDKVWRKSHTPGFGTVPPKDVTDSAILAYRDHPGKKFVVHYMQPHAPFLHCPGKYGSINKEKNQGKSQMVWRGLQAGQYDKEEIWEDYGENLLSVLDQVEMLLNNVDGDVVITADHGNALGEFRLYGHPGYVPAPSIKKVPWVEVKANNIQNYNPNTKKADAKTSVEDHLKDLGYL